MSKNHRHLESLPGGAVDPSDISTNREDLEAHVLRLGAARVAIERHRDPAQFYKLGDTTKLLWNAFVLFEVFGRSEGHRSLNDISTEYAAAYALTSPDTDSVTAYKTAVQRHAKALEVLRGAMFDSQAQFIADYPEDDWSDKELKENVFDGIGQSADILRLILPQNEDESRSEYLARLKQFLQKSIDAISLDQENAEDNIALIAQADTITDALENLEEVYGLDKDNELVLLNIAFSALIELAREPDHDPAHFAHKKIRQLSDQTGEENKRAESMRIYDALKFLELVYEGLYKSGDPEDDRKRHQKFIDEQFPSAVFEDPEAETYLRTAINASYKILKIMVGPRAEDHRDLLPPIDKMKEIFLWSGAKISDPDSIEAGRLRYLAWHGQPDIYSE